MAIVCSVNRVAMQSGQTLKRPRRPVNFLALGLSNRQPLSEAEISVSVVYSYVCTTCENITGVRM